MRIVVTGATGNVGTSVVEALRADPSVDSILALARRPPASDLGGGKVAWAAADVASSDLEGHFRGADAVVHLAWVIQRSHDTEGMERVNVGGSRRVFEAAAAAGVGAIVYASSVGAYSPGPKDAAVDESWATDGVPTSFYSRHKAAVERILDEFEAAHPGIRVVRLRPGLIFKRQAATGIRRLFFGPLAPTRLLRPALIPVVPKTDRLVFQAVHTDDVAEAYRLAVLSDARGAFNIAADPVLDGDELGRILGARPVRVPGSVLRAGAALTWWARLQPTPPGWVDLALEVPVLDTGRARRELGWHAARTSAEALLDLLAGLADGTDYPTPALARRGGVPPLPGPDAPAARILAPAGSG